MLHMPRSKIASMIRIKDTRDTIDMPAWIIFAPDRLAESQRRLERSRCLKTQEIASNGTTIIVQNGA